MFAIFAIMMIAGSVAAVVAHYVFLGPKHPELCEEPPAVRRFFLWERAVHGMTLLSFLVLAGTGFSALLTRTPLRGIPLLLHWIAAPFFALGLMLMILAWAGYGRFEPFDLAWFRVFGGYLGGDHGEVPAGRFNAGQKAFLWGVAGLGALVILSGAVRIYPVFGSAGQAAMLVVHRLAALFLFCAIVAHAYLGTFANPGTVQAMLTGRVGRRWAWAHHPVWARRLGIAAPEAGRAGETSAASAADPIEPPG